MFSSYTTAGYEAIIVNYTPHAMHSEPWSHVAGFTREYMHTLNTTPDNTSRDALRNTLNCVSKLAAQVWVSYDVVTVETVFHPDIIENYSLAGDGARLGPSVAGTQRSLLCRVAEVINDDRNPDYQHLIDYEPALEPYDSYACDRMWDWVESQPTAAHRRNFTTVLMLTLGAGLRAEEIYTLRGKGVHVGNDGVLLSPHGYRGADPREVPLLKSHIEVLQPVIMTTGPEDYLFGLSHDNESVSQLSTYLRRVAPSTSPDIVSDTRKLRSTQIVGRITTGVPADMLYAVAGLRSLH